MLVHAPPEDYTNINACKCKKNVDKLFSNQRWDNDSDSDLDKLYGAV